VSELLWSRAKKKIIGTTSAFDGMVLFLPVRLQESPTVFTVKKEFDQSTVEVTLTLTQELPPASPTCLQLFNIIFRRDLSLIGMKQIGRNYFCPDEKIAVDRHKMEVWPGFSTSIAQYEKNVMLCADLSHKVMRKITVLDMMLEMYQKFGPRFKDMCVKNLVGEIVLTRYNNKTYRIDDIDFEKNPMYSFEGRKGENMTLVDYYKKAYQLNVTDLKQPLLVSNPKAKDRNRGQTGPIFLVPELCVLTGLSDDMRADFNVMKDLAVHTRIDPNNRYKKLMMFINRLANNPEVQKEMGGWGLRFAKNLLQFNGRVLPTEQISQRTGQYTYQQETADWTRNMRDQKLLTSVNLQKWVVVCTKRDQGPANDLVMNLKKVGPPMGIMVNNPEVVALNDDRTDTFFRALQASVNNDTQLVMVMVPSNRKDRYDAIKKFCCVDHPVPSQVVVARTVLKAKGLMSVATKIMIQINCKLGGEVWALQIPLQNCMVIGVDTYHERGNKSVGAFVASLNKTFTRYYSRCSVQEKGQELSDALRTHMTAAIRKYHEVNKGLPDRIILFRDGVGDGQLAAVYEHEIPQLQACFGTVHPGYDPKFCAIVVKKRISTRFFAGDQGRGFRNPLPGTVADMEVTRPDWYDFFLVSQSVRQGTVSPTHYNVIFDTSGLKPDHIQKLAYKLTHLYYNWPGTIRVPAPCQYAHKLAFLVGQSIHKEPSHELSDRLFYL